MWTANAATVSPSADSADGKVHFTVANLNNKLHRMQEAPTTSAILGATFADPRYFAHHAALPQHGDLGDEGAANHNRFCREYDRQGVQFFVYGRRASGGIAPVKYPARQTLEASEAVARLHQLDPRYTVFAQQGPQAIDRGVFHNDVIAVSNRHVLFHHQQAFVDQATVLATLRAKSDSLDIPFTSVEVPDERVSLDDAVASYLFNSQLLSKPDGKMLIVVPEECRQRENVWRYLSDLAADSASPIDEVAVFDLRESMRNGGGPACLRLRVVLNEAERQAVNAHSLMNDERYQQLTAWVEKHYRDRLHARDLADPQLLREVYQALDELTQILRLARSIIFSVKERQMEHLVNDLLHCRLQAWTFPAGIEARWLGEGILQLLPTAPWREATILSAGVHGNETAPIELLLQLTHDLSQGGSRSRRRC